MQFAYLKHTSPDIGGINGHFLEKCPFFISFKFGGIENSD